nr:60S ribosomal protein L3-like [Tanacetum cinerariifolium]
MRAYIKTPCGLRSLNTVSTQHLSEGVKRRFYKNRYKSNKKAFDNYSKKFESIERKRDIQCLLESVRCMKKSLLSSVKDLKSDG